MTRARGWGAVLAGAAACCLALAGALPAAGATGSRPQAAYWWQPEPVSGLIPVPGVPSNGLYVASSSSGPQAESAVRFRVADPAATVRLTLHVSANGAVGDPAVFGYPAASRWSTGGPQAWSSRPSYRSRATPARGVFHSSGSAETMTIDFPASEGVLGVVLVPAGADSSGQPPTFSVAFGPPQAHDIAVVSASSPSSAPSAHHPPTPKGHTPGTGPARPRPGSPSATASGHATAGKRAAPRRRASASPDSSTPAAPPVTAGRPPGRPARSRSAATTIAVVVGGIIAGGLLILVGGRAARRR